MSITGLITKFAAQNDGDPGKYIGGKGEPLEDSINTIISGIIAALGIVCVIVMIIGGVNYMTSSGDTAKVKKAKDTILYGLIGLIVCVLAYAIVNFVISNIINGS